ncbi:hypothetical protein BGX26_004413 [Mortierella sp. AD094]|nr:hypothetical protein BGX26_004413 [Mortierella sp. AD094]
MLRIGQYGGRRIIARASSIPSAIPSSARHRFISTTHARNDKISWTPSTAWFLGAGVVFTGVSLVLQSPSLGLSDCAVQNESPSSDAGKSTSLGARLAGYFTKKPQPIDQKDIVLDTDLTVTSWKQLEQTGLIKIPGIMLWGSNKYVLWEFIFTTAKAAEYTYLPRSVAFRNGLIDPSGKSPGVIQIPQRLDAFQGAVLRDLKLGEDVAGMMPAE